jgi:MoxR-like ATPase
LPPLFLVMATQNPIEQEGTYPLPEAQLDRFLLHVRVTYPDKDASRKILQLVRHEALCTLEQTRPHNVQKVKQEQVFTARREIMQLHLAPAVEEYIVELIETTRNPEQYGQELSSWIRWGASPRGAIAIERAARATAWLAERDFVTPEDVQKVAADALRHRILLNYEAEAEGITTQQCIDQILVSVPAP